MENIKHMPPGGSAAAPGLSRLAAHPVRRSLDRSSAPISSGNGRVWQCCRRRSSWEHRAVTRANGSDARRFAPKGHPAL